MKKSLKLLLALVLTAFFSAADASASQWFGYALYTSNGADWQNHFISFDAQNPDAVQAVSDEFPTVWAATYLDGYVWFVTNTRSLCKAPFDEETQTIGAYETVVPALEQYNLYIGMAYNYADGMMYYLCQDSQYNMYLKRSNLNNPSEVELVGSLSQKIWTLAINAQGQAYGVAYEGGDLYQINLNDASTTLVGPTGKEVWYTQSMAFDLETGELFWAQFSTVSDHGFYQVNTETGAATLIGEIGAGTQLAGLFMVYEQTPPAPEIISEIYIEGFTAPVWGEHPDYTLTVPDDAPYHISDLSWHWEYMLEDPTLYPEDIFDDEEKPYYLKTIISHRPGYEFDPHPTVYYNGDATIFELGQIFGDDYIAFTISFYVTDPTGIAEHATENTLLWPNPVADILYLNATDGADVTSFDITGRVVKQEKYKGKISVSDMASGVYAVKVEGVTVRFVKE